MTINYSTTATLPAKLTPPAMEGQFQGELIGPDHPAYEEARQIWNGMINRRPALIARCSSVADVRAAVRFARERDLLVAVRGGGHNVAGTAVCDDGLVIDLSALKGIRVNPTVRTVNRVFCERVRSGNTEIRSGHYGGIVTHTGLAGLFLGGAGLADAETWFNIDNLLSAG
jgi:hypothetical protein